jgi:hypothetical protein
MNINVWKNLQVDKYDQWGNKIGSEKTQGSENAVIDDNEIIALLGKLLLSKKEVLLDLLKQ